MEIERGPDYTNVQTGDSYIRIKQNLDAIYANLEKMAGGNANTPAAPDHGALLQRYMELVSLISPKLVAVPAANNSPGSPGQFAYAPGFLYVCVAASTWQRVVIATF